MNEVNAKYEGLNLPQLLDLMHGLVLPDPVSLVPQTDGWWVLAAWIAAVLALCVRAYLQHRRKNRYRREALASLAELEAAPKDDPARSATAVAILLKRTALAVWPRHEVASIYGGDWASFLVQSSRQDPKVAAFAEDLARAPYTPDVDVEPLFEPARCWIKAHRA